MLIHLSHREQAASLWSLMLTPVIGISAGFKLLYFFSAVEKRNNIGTISKATENSQNAGSINAWYLKETANILPSFTVRELFDFFKIKENAV